MNKELWIFLFLLGTLLVNWPFLAIFSLSVQYYLFGVWALFILVLGFLMSEARPKRTKNKNV